MLLKLLKSAKKVKISQNNSTDASREMLTSYFNCSELGAQ